MGKDERAISVSGYVHRGLVKYTARAFEKTIIYKRHSRDHLLDQVESFRIGDRGSDCEDDLLDTFCYGIALALGNSEGFWFKDADDDIQVETLGGISIGRIAQLRPKEGLGRRFGVARLCCRR
jgi:hypothetical protein